MHYENKSCKRKKIPADKVARTFLCAQEIPVKSVCFDLFLCADISDTCRNHLATFVIRYFSVGFIFYNFLQPTISKIQFVKKILNKTGQRYEYMTIPKAPSAVDPVAP